MHCVYQFYVCHLLTHSHMHIIVWLILWHQIPYAQIQSWTLSNHSFREFAIVRKSYSLVLAYNPSCTYSSKQPHVITTFWYQVPYPYSSGTIWPTWEISPGNLNLLVHRYFTCCLKISSFPVLGSTSLVLRLYFILTNLYLSLSLWGALLFPLREKGE